ncbi:winged helix-turn-helix transcriptional regulator [Myxacorys almedinensis]|uniref:Transcriptional regulator n=1 Tax=Myxacorys almedinensis A TaxID=2690445 RepID=A0A8J7Z8X7_9CYAN|nr:helix-turn-helix domain-containing protein [Myxacorys almedinensis]NDJ17610.1 transcriptional regulator [Myxacorys almedinensis A]
MQERRSSCPIACTLDLIGDRWTLLIIRDMLFLKKQRFDEFLDSPEGISTNILTDRLKKLEHLGLVSKQPYSAHSRRMNYHLTEQGESLRPVLKAIAKWGLSNVSETQPAIALPFSPPPLLPSSPSLPLAQTDEPLLD